MNKMLRGLILGAILTTMAGCSGSGGGSADGGSTTSDLTIAGALGSTSLNVMSKASNKGTVGKFGSYDDIKFYVTAFTEPPQIKAVDLNSDGSFSLTIPGASGSVIEASFKLKSDPTVVKPIKFVDSSQKSLSDGQSSKFENYLLKGTVNFGTLNISGGEATIDVVNVIPAENKGGSTSGVTGFDFSGAWTMGAYSLPAALVDEGFKTAEDPNGTPPFSCGNEPCLPIGMPLTLVKIEGKDFTPGTGCTDDDCKDDGTEGTVGTATKYGISIWEGPVSGTGSGVQSCGYKTGFTPHSARYGAGIHVTSAVAGSQALTIEDFTFDSLGTGTEPWMIDTARAKYSHYDCSPKSHTVSGTTYNLFACKALVWANHDDNSTPMDPNDDDYSGDKTIYHISEQSADNGCVEDTTNKPIHVSDWSIQPDDMNCWNGTEVFTGFRRTECHYTNKDPDGSGSLAATSFTCKHGHGTFGDNAGAVDFSAPLNHGDYFTGTSSGGTTRDGSPALLFSGPSTPNGNDGTLCSTLPTVTDAQKLMAYQCYAQNYHDADASGCVQEYHFNWGATDPANFVMNNGRNRPKSNFLTDLLTYSADGNSFFVNASETETVGIRTNDSGGMEFCDVKTTTKIVGKKVSDTKLLMTLVESGTLLSDDKTACVAAVNAEDSWENGNLSYRVKEGMKAMFYLNK